MSSMWTWLFLFAAIASTLAAAFRSVGVNRRIGTFSSLRMSNKDFAIMVNGMPGPMALEVAKVCVDRGLTLAPIGFTGPDTKDPFIVVEGKVNKQKVELIRGPPNEAAIAALKSLKKDYPNLVLVDYTHPSAILGNLQAYVENDCDFVMGTTGGDPTRMNEIFNQGKNFAVIAPNMGKQIVAMQAALLEMAQRFPGSFKGYKLTVTESHQSTKADTSGTAKAVVSHLVGLSECDFTVENIVMLRDKESQLNFGVPEESLRGHAFHTYRLKSPDGSVAFELQHNVCGRRVYAEGTCDAVEFLYRTKKQGGSKRLFNMIDVLEAGAMK